LGVKRPGREAKCYLSFSPNNNNNNNNNRVLRYTCVIINWRLEKITKIDRKTRMTLTMYKMHHPTADTDGLYVKRKGGGRGLHKWKQHIKQR
jgi:hypothetical protein